MNLTQIEERLNKEFNSREGRRLIFWFDAAGEFAEDIDSISLKNAKLYKLAVNDQFYTKYFLECVDTETNYLIYAPFAEPAEQENYLADMVHYSMKFHANKIALLCSDLGVERELRPLFVKHRKFFDSKERESKFLQLKPEKLDEESFLVAMMSALCKCRTASFEEVLRVALTKWDSSESNPVLDEFDRYGLLDDFWRLCSKCYGYMPVGGKPTLSSFVLTLFVTYTAQTIKCDIPKAWSAYLSPQRGNVAGFMCGIMDNVNYQELWLTLSNNLASAELDASAYLSKVELGDLLDCDAFDFIDEWIANWIAERLLAEDFDARLDGKGFTEIIAKRKSKHFGREWNERYEMLSCAGEIASCVRYQPASTLKEMMEKYQTSDWRVDMSYRHFYYYYDKLKAVEREPFERLRLFIENIYINEYLEKQSQAWTMELEAADGLLPAVQQRAFYKRFVDCHDERVIVIISDALRYETARELYERLVLDEKCRAELDVMAGVVPSFTKLGMAALLPNAKLSLSDDATKVMVDEHPCDSTEQRGAILKSAAPESACLLFDEVMNAKREEVRSLFTNRKVVYVYHNQIDARGDKPASENEVFNACAEAMDEIYSFISRLTEAVSARYFIVTADHGFLYRRDKLQEYAKVEGASGGFSAISKRFAITSGESDLEGARPLKLKSFIGGEDKRYVFIPAGAGIFKTSGSGQNYVHGGAAPQEMLVPVLKVRTLRGHLETHPVSIDLITPLQKITSLNQTLDFIQREPVSDVAKEATYKFFFISEINEKISGEYRFTASSREEEPQKRIFQVKFLFKNRKYGGERYYLKVYNDASAIEEPVIVREVIMDIAFAEDFGF